MNKKIYKAEFECNNSSADGYGYFSTRELAQKELDKKKDTVIKDIKENAETGDYYYSGNINECLFRISEIDIDIQID